MYQPARFEPGEHGGQRLRDAAGVKGVDEQLGVACLAPDRDPRKRFRTASRVQPRWAGIHGQEAQQTWASPPPR